MTQSTLYLERKLIEAVFKHFSQAFNNQHHWSEPHTYLNNYDYTFWMLHEIKLFLILPRTPWKALKDPWGSQEPTLKPPTFGNHCLLSCVSVHARGKSKSREVNVAVWATFMVLTWQNLWCNTQQMYVPRKVSLLQYLSIDTPQRQTNHITKLWLSVRGALEGTNRPTDTPPRAHGRTKQKATEAGFSPPHLLSDSQSTSVTAALYTCQASWL